MQEKTFWRFLIIITILWMLIRCCPANAGNRQGWFGEVRGDYGFGIEKDYTGFKVAFGVGHYMSDSFSIRAEGNVTDMMIDDGSGASTYLGGASFILRYDPRIWKDYRLYFDAGVGVGYVPNSSRPNLLKDGMAGILDGGIGVIMPATKNIEFVLGWKFMHISSLKPNDKGVNFQGVMVGIRF